jgi:hypothetical protein
MGPEQLSQRGQAEAKGSTETLSREVALDVLSNERRRYVIHYLKRRGGTVPLGDLTEAVAGWELGKPPTALDYKERKRVKNALQQFHLPKMQEVGFVEYDRDRGTVELSGAARRQDFYVDVLPARAVPWGVYYVGLALASLVVFVGMALQVGPFASLPPVAWVGFVTVALAVSSVGHFYDNYYRMRLGAREHPPDLD